MPSYIHINAKNHFTETNLQGLIHAEDTLLCLMFKAKSEYELNLINSYFQNKDLNSFR